MKIYERFKNRFLEEDYYISFYKNNIYLMNYKEIEEFNERKLIIVFNTFNIVISGSEFKILRKNDLEIEVAGKVNSMEIVNE